MALRLIVLLYYSLRVFLAEVDDQLTIGTRNQNELLQQTEADNPHDESNSQRVSLSSTKESAPIKSSSDKVYSCPLCLDEIRQPAVIPCGHMGCWKCLMSYALKTPISSSGASSSTNPSLSSAGYRPNALIKCPVCRYEFYSQKIRPLIL